MTTPTKTRAKYPPKTRVRVTVSDVVGRVKEIDDDAKTVYYLLDCSLTWYAESILEPMEEKS